MAVNRLVYNNMRPVHACQYPNCTKTYVNSSILKRHIQAFHNSEKRFQCPSCGKCLASRQNLKEHLYIHSGEKPYKCPEPGCGASFRQGTHLSAHKKIEHSGYPDGQIRPVLKVELTSQVLTASDSHSYEEPLTEEMIEALTLRPISAPYICILPNIFQEKCCRCFTKEKDIISPQLELPQEAHVQVPEQQQPEPPVQIETKFRLVDVTISEFTPSNTQKLNFSYNCPICLRYFNTILVLKCCKQYICHFCIEDLSRSVNFEVACPHCKKIPVQASDVDFNSTVKRYSDSPFGTFKQSKDRENRWVQLKVVNESVESDQSIKALDNLNFSFNHEPPVENSNLRMTA